MGAPPGGHEPDQTAPESSPGGSPPPGDFAQPGPPPGGFAPQAPPPPGGTGHGGYPPQDPQVAYTPPGAYGQAPPSGSNGMAIGALVCGILALLSGIFGLFLITLPLAFILGIVAVVLGILAQRRAREAGVGRGQAISGIVTGAVGLVAALAWTLFFIFAWGAMVEQFGNPFEDPEGFQERIEELEEEQLP